MTRVYYKSQDGALRALDANTADPKSAIWAVGSHLVSNPKEPQAKGPVLAVIDGDKPEAPMPLHTSSSGYWYDDEPPKGAA